MTPSGRREGLGRPFAEQPEVVAAACQNSCGAGARAEAAMRSQTSAAGRAPRSGAHPPGTLTHHHCGRAVAGGTRRSARLTAEPAKTGAAGHQHPVTRVSAREHLMTAGRTPPGLNHATGQARTGTYPYAGCAAMVTVLETGRETGHERLCGCGRADFSREGCGSGVGRGGAADSFGPGGPSTRRHEVG